MGEYCVFHFEVNSGIKPDSFKDSGTKKKGNMEVNPRCNIDCNSWVALDTWVLFLTPKDYLLIM